MLNLCKIAEFCIDFQVMAISKHCYKILLLNFTNPFTQEIYWQTLDIRIKISYLTEKLWIVPFHKSEFKMVWQKSGIS